MLKIHQCFENRNWCFENLRGDLKIYGEKQDFSNTIGISKICFGFLKYHWVFRKSVQIFKMLLEFQKSCQEFHHLGVSNLQKWLQLWYPHKEFRKSTCKCMSQYNTE